MKILFVLEHYYPYIGGTETLFQTLAENLAKNHVEVIVLTSQLPNTPKTETMKKVKIFRVEGIKNFERYSFILQAIPKAIQLARDVDIVHTTTYTSAIPALIAAKLTRKKIVITVHEVLNKIWFRIKINPIIALGFYIFEKLVINLPFDKFIAVSDFTLKRIPNKNKTRIYNALDYRKLRKIKPRKQNYYLFFGRPGYVKGLEDLIIAFSKIKDQTKKLTIILSKSPLRLYQKRLQEIEQLPNKNQILILPSQPRQKLLKFIANAKAVIIPSISEGFCFAAAEANALGTPVIYRNVGSLPEVVSYGIPFQTTDELTQILENFPKPMRRRLKLFPIKNFINEYISVYKTL